MGSGETVTPFQRDRRRLVERLRAGGVQDLAILHAFDSVPRHHFVPEALHGRAYEDAALPIGGGQTISRPSVHARHLELAGIHGGERVLEIGTGSGFQTALLVALGATVCSIERLERLAARARAALETVGLNADIHVGDGSRGWPEKAPFDVILVGAAADRVPGALLAQLAEGGRLIVPVGDEEGQSLHRFIRRGNECVCEKIDRARFVPLVRRAAPR